MAIVKILANNRNLYNILLNHLAIIRILANNPIFGYDTIRSSEYNQDPC